MKRFVPLLIVAVALLGGLIAAEALAGGHRHAETHANRMARRSSWHGEYQHTASGYAVPLVVPPTANAMTEYGWGVTQQTVRPIYHQFRRGYSGGAESEYDGLQPTPMWPSHTRQFGVYPVRAPW